MIRNKIFSHIYVIKQMVDILGLGLDNDVHYVNRYFKCKNEKVKKEQRMTLCSELKNYD